MGRAPIPASDFWSVGAFLFEAFCGKSLASCHPGGIHTHLPLKFPKAISAEAESLLQHLLQVDSRERSGAGPTGIEEIKVHAFFHGINWESLQK